MKKKLIFPLVCASLLVFSSCGGKSDPTPTSSTPTPSEPSTPTPTPSKPVGPQPIDNDSDLPLITSYYEEPSVQIHYQRTEGTYKEWGLWLWADGKDGAEYEFNYQDDYGVVAYYPLSYFGNPHNLGFIVKKLFKYAGDGNWVKDGQSDRFMDIDMLKIDEHQAYHVYIKNKSSTVYTNAERTMVMNAVTSCQFIDNDRILIEVNNPITNIVIKRNGKEVAIKRIIKENSGSKQTVILEEPADVADIFTAEVTFEDGIFCNKSVSIRNLYNDDFGEKYNYDGELGALYTKEKTTFKVWSPVSQSITVRIYDNGTPTSVDPKSGNDVYEEIPMVKGERGVFTAEAEGNLEGYYYTYFVVNSSSPDGKEIVDPYAKSAGVNGLRGMIVDFNKTNPDGWNEVNYLTYDRKELTVYETHIAELTCSDTWGGNPQNAKLFNGFHESGTKHTKNGVTVTTGFDHIKELGVNAVQIIPFFDQANDETNMTFNWGYNPLNYNVIEGGYSSNPYDGYVRIRELKELIKDYNEAGISIIMDVVYNHVNGLTGSNFDILMPYYYFRYTSTGGASNGSGCGNETASDKYMFRKFMIDSVKFWTEEYKLGGFRFDLMGIHDIETMDLLTEEATKINEHICIYGEPWAGGTTALPAGFTAAVQNNASKFKGYGQFNDIMRDAMIKSGMNTLGNKGWVTQANSKTPTSDIKDGMNGKTGKATDDPNKTVNYATCHDNYTLHDRALVAGVEDEETIAKMNMLANSVVFTSQATTFMLAGEEMLRTKVVYDVDGNPIPAKDEDGNELGYNEVSGNSYSSSYKTNEINYDWKIAHLDMFENYQKLIKLKQEAEGLHSEVATNSVTSQDEDSVIKTTFEYQGKTVVVYHANGTVKDTEVNVNGCELYLDTLGRTLNGENHKLEPFETLIITK